MSIEFGEGNKEYMQKIDKAMSLIRKWVKPDGNKVRYEKETGSISFVKNRVDFAFFHLKDIDINPDVVELYTGHSIIYIHDNGWITLMIESK